MDNASNNDRFIYILQRTLLSRGIQFGGSTQRIRCVQHSYKTWSNFPFNSCFPHIINLACKAMISEMSGLIPQEDSIKRLKTVIHDVSLEIYIWAFT